MNKEELKQKCADLGIDIQGLDTNAKLEDAIKAKEAELVQIGVTAKVETGTSTEEADKDSNNSETTSEETVTEKSASEKEAEEAEAEEKPAPFYKDSRGRKWSFKAKAPGTLNIGGHPMTQEEILNSEEVITELVYGNSSYLTQID